MITAHTITLRPTLSRGVHDHVDGIQSEETFVTQRYILWLCLLTLKHFNYVRVNIAKEKKQFSSKKLFSPK